MQTYLKRTPAFLQLLIFLGLSIGMGMAVLVIGGLVLAQFTGIPIDKMGKYFEWDAANPAIVKMLRGTILLQFLGLFVIPSLLYARLVDTRPGAYLGLRRPGRPIYWILGIAAMLCAIPLAEWSGVVNAALLRNTPFIKYVLEMEKQATEILQFLLNRRTPGQLLLNIIFIALFAGVGEELFFRGVIQRLLIRGTRSPWAGILLTAFLFSAFHFQFMGFLPRFILGIILGAIYWYSGSLWTAMLAHFLYDALFIVIAYYVPETITSEGSLMEGNPGLLLMAAASAVITVFLILIMKRRSKTSFEEAYGDELYPTTPDNRLSF